MAKSPAAVTTSVTFAVRETGPLVPRMASGYEPGGVAAVVATVRDVDPDPVTLVGPNVAVAPEGRPLTAKVTVPLNPDSAPTVAV